MIQAPVQIESVLILPPQWLGMNQSLVLVMMQQCIPLISLGLIPVVSPAAACDGTLRTPPCLACSRQAWRLTYTIPRRTCEDNFHPMLLADLLVPVIIFNSPCEHAVAL